MVVPHRIGAESCNVLRQSAINDGSGGGSGCKIAGDPRETPSRRAIPEVRNGRVIVQVQAVNQFLAVKIPFVRVTDIGIVASKAVVFRVVRHLKKAADVAGPCPGQEERYVLRKFKAAILGRWDGGLGCGK